ncbi:MAG: DUF4105 domain-containing protein [Oligoflexia bacterium]|nr:DUF4105 domain-containing protein [Oligoflexia bacterium]
MKSLLSFKGAVKALVPVWLAVELLVACAFADGATTDPYLPDAVVPNGPHKGLPIYAKRKRPLVILPPEKAAHYDPDPENLVFANFYSEGKLWIASLPKNAVESVIFQIDEDHSMGIKPLISHVQLRFKLKQGRELRLFPQSGASPKNASVNDIVLSAETTMPKGVDFSLVKGFLNHYVRTVRLLSSADAFKIGAVMSHHRFEQVLLSMDDAKKSQLLEQAIRLSDESQFKIMYHTAVKNCSTFVFCDLFGNVFQSDSDAKVAKKVKVPLLTFGPLLKTNLRRRGLIDPVTNGRLPDWNDEWSDRIPAGSRISKKSTVDCIKTLLTEGFKKWTGKISEMRP